MLVEVSEFMVFKAMGCFRGGFQLTMSIWWYVVGTAISASFPYFKAEFVRAATSVPGGLGALELSPDEADGSYGGY